MAGRQSALVQALPHLRQYMYCITGSRDYGDDVIKQWLTALSGGGDLPVDDATPVEIFALFHAHAPNHLDRQKLTDGRSPEEEGLHARVLALPVRERQILVLRAVLDFDQEEVSEILDIPERFVRRFLHRAENSLKRSHHTALVMEDEALQGIEIARALSHMGFEVAPPVTTGQEAIETAERLRPDLIVADLSLAGGEDGLNVLRRICTEQQPAIIYVTAYPERASALDGDLSGPVLSKPITPSKLITVVHEEMERAS